MRNELNIKPHDIYLNIIYIAQVLAQPKRSASSKSTVRSLTTTQKGKKCDRHNLPLKGMSERFISDDFFEALPKE